ncbi:hypothetical protein M378DRAFT_107654, partial [Amanita muscaria Koide BX008]
MDDKKPATAIGFFHGASNINASENSFTEVHGSSYQTNVNNYGVSSLTLPLRVYPSGILSPFYTGHESYLRDLKDYFAPVSDNSPLVRKSFLLYGKGGSGKTQLSLKFIVQVQDWFPDILWIDASTENSILSSLQDFAGAWQLASASPSYICSRISSLESNWLLVFDNVDIGYKSLGKYFPPGNRGNILITSRRKELERVT